MKSKLALLSLLFALSFGGLVNKAVGAGLVPAHLSSDTSWQGQALLLQNNWSRGFLFVALKPDGVNAVRPQHKKRPKRKSKHKAKAKVGPRIAGMNTEATAIPEETTMRASAPKT